jgi:hypothetical protein
VRSRPLALSLVALLAAASARAALEPVADEPSFPRPEPPALVVEFAPAPLGDTEPMPTAGVVVTRDGLVFVDGPEVPLERVEWVESVEARPVRLPVTSDTTLKVGPGSLLAIAGAAGPIRVVAWARNDVRLRVVHDRTVRLGIERTGGRLQAFARADDGSPAVAEWEVTVPEWLPLELSGREGDIEVTGLRAPLRAHTMRGDVRVSSCRGPLQAHSVEGEVSVTDVDGNVTAGSVDNVVRIVRVRGPVEAQSVNGDIQIDRLESPTVDASSVNGHVLVLSPFRPRGRYAFASHRGRVLVAMPEDQDVRVRVLSHHGRIESGMSVPLPRMEDAGPGRMRMRGRALRFVLTGDGAPAPAHLDDLPELDLESFGGTVRFASPAEVRTLLLERGSHRRDSMRVRMRVRRD